MFKANEAGVDPKVADRTFTSKISEEKSQTLIKDWDKAVTRAKSWENS